MELLGAFGPLGKLLSHMITATSTRLHAGARGMRTSWRGCRHFQEHGRELSEARYLIIIITVMIPSNVAAIVITITFIIDYVLVLLSFLSILLMLLLFG